jgi:hypothetical protein
LKANTVELQAYEMTRKVITQLRAEGKLPPASMFNDDDYEDTVSEVYTYQILPMLKRFDPAVAKLTTFIYPAIVRWAPRTAWKLKKGGINTMKPIELIPMPEPGEIDGVSEDGDPEYANAYSVTASNDTMPSPAEMMTYPDPPQDYEVPGSDAWEDTQLRGARVAHMRRLIESLPKGQRRAIQKRVLSEKPTRGRMPARATICEIARGLEARFSRRDLETLNNRGDKNKVKAASAPPLVRAPQGLAADADLVFEKLGSTYGRR